MDLQASAEKWWKLLALVGGEHSCGRAAAGCLVPGRQA